MASVSLDIRLWPRLDNYPVGSFCWLWTGALTKGGYGEIYYEGHMVSVHRLVWFLLMGPIPNGLELDHKLRCSKTCANPAHLEPVTHQENDRRRSATITHCPQGHPYDSLNTYLSFKGHRFCRACDARRHAARKLKGS